MQDRRTSKTRARIKDAVLKILRHKSIADISVTDVCKSVDISRSTFYLHFDNISEVVYQAEDGVIEDLRSIMMANISSSSAVVYHIGVYIRKNAETLTTILNATECHFGNMIEREIEPVLLSLSDFCNNQKMTRYFVTFLVYGCVGMFRRWVGEGRDITSSQLIETFIQYFKTFSKEP